MDILSNPIRHYEWGSYTDIADMQGRPSPSAEPEAELWIGAHPGDPSFLGDRSLLEVIASDPAAALGVSISGEHGAELPFLAKMLCARKALSIQIHPNPAQAREGFAAEEVAGVPLDARDRNYKDPYAKPEIIVALTTFHALCGFRPAEESAALIRRLVGECPGLLPTLAALDAGDLKTAITGLLMHPTPSDLVAEVAAAVPALAGDDPAYEWVGRLAELFPGDIGSVVSLLLRYLRLEPGQALYQPAGVLHAYLMGTGFEVMGASDNTLRAALTPKYVDVAEVLRLLRFVVEPPLIVDAVVKGNMVVWPTSATEFEVARVDLAKSEQTVAKEGTPMVMFCVDGTVEVFDGTSQLSLSKGSAAWVPANVAEVTVRGTGSAFVVTVPR